MRHILTIIIAFHWTAVFALLAVASMLNPEQGILAALSFLGASPTPDAFFSGGGLLAAGVFSFAFAVASVLFLWTLATALLGESFPFGGSEHVARLAFCAGIAAFSLFLLCGPFLAAPHLFLTSTIAVGALLASYLTIFAERWSVSVSAAPADSDLRAAARLMAAGAAHGALLSRISGRTRGA